MLKFTLKRCIETIPTLIMIIFICFLIMRLAPGNPFDSEKPIAPEIKAKLMQKYHLDKPFYMQAYYYIANILKGDFGPSLVKKDLNVNQYIKLGIPRSLTLGLVSLIISLTLGILLGTIAAIKKNTHIDYIIRLAAMFGLSVPTFVTGPFLQYFLSIKLGLFYTSGWISERGGLSNLIMPILTMSLPWIAIFTRITRGSTLEMLNSDFIRTAKAKGLSFNVIIRKHVLVGSLLPLISYIGPAFAGIISGSIVIEQIFRIAGMGMFTVEASLNRDYPLLMGSLLIYSIILLLSILASDLVYKKLDPRI